MRVSLVSQLGDPECKSQLGGPESTHNLAVRRCPPVMARRISRAASSRISMDACSLYQAACGVQMRLGASFRGPWLKLMTHGPVGIV